MGVRPWEHYYSSLSKSSEQSSVELDGAPWLVEQLARSVLKLSPAEDFPDSSEETEELTAQSPAADADARPLPIATSDSP